MSKKGDYQIPFDVDGNMQDYPTNSYRNGITIPPNWRDKFIFDDTLTYTTYGRGRSSVIILMKRTDETLVSMFISDFTAAISYMINGKLRGRFTFTKKGQNYGCKLLIDEYDDYSISQTVYTKPLKPKT